MTTRWPAFQESCWISNGIGSFSKAVGNATYLAGELARLRIHDAPQSTGIASGAGHQETGASLTTARQ